MRPDQEWLKSELDDCMHQIWFNAEIEQIDRMIYYIMSEDIPVDYQVIILIQYSISFYSLNVFYNH